MNLWTNIQESEKKTDMKWKKITIETTTQAEEFLEAMLLDLGIDSFEIEDSIPLSKEDQKKMFIDFLPESKPDDKVARLSFYRKDDNNLKELLKKVSDEILTLANFTDVGLGKITVSETEDKDWINNWKEFFKPFRVDDTIIIKPTWEELKEKKEGDLVIELDPGTAFGTGSHETTKLCITQLKRYVKPESSVLDLGCGSGILSILSRKLGAGFVVGTDIDTNAVKVSKENCSVNGLDSEGCFDGLDTKEIEKVFQTAKTGCGFLCCDVLQDQKARDVFQGKFDLVTANILADVIVPLAGMVGNFLKPDGYFISSGIIDFKAEEVKKALLSNHWKIVGEYHLGDWVCFVAAF